MSFLKRGRRAALTAITLTGAVFSQGCLQRDVKPDSPNTSNVFVEQIANNKISAIDLLFVIDNSVSMGDKQAILQRAVPQMVGRLISPLCIDNDGNPEPNGVGADLDGRCPDGFAAEFQPVNNIHIGVISSSIGGHGSNQCVGGDEPAHYYDDKAHLIATVRGVDASPFDDTGFLAWNEETAGQGPQALVNAFANHVDSVGENGCGFEAPLEAWYRFLVDPAPYVSLAFNERGATYGVDVDQTVLAQREAFLRPDGLVAIVVLTDENDCSAMDGGVYYNNAGFGYLISSTKLGGEDFNMAIATDECAANPNDKCCFSCLQWNDPPAGCEAAAQVCMGGEASPLTREKDNANVRCFDNRRRFGVDLLYPTSRYVDALSRPELINSQTGTPFPNPLLRGAGANAGQAREEGLVFFAGIVGVPWQDLATPESLDPNSPTMKLLTAPELNVANVPVGAEVVDRWQVILGQPNLPANSRACSEANEACGQAPVPPLDPFMVESVEPRPAGALNPISMDPIVAANSNDPMANRINGHEVDNTIVTSVQSQVRDDLQYACIFPLEPEAVESKTNCSSDDSTCDCGQEPDRNRPLCQPPGGGAAGTTQYFGKAYPGTRILQVLKDFGGNSIVGSICPKNAVVSAAIPATDPNYGYNPAVQAIVDRLAEKLSGKCLPRELSANEDGTVPCTIVEAKPAGSDKPLDCSAPGRGPAEKSIQDGIRAQLEVLERCGGNSGIPCETYEMCIIQELLGDGRQECLYNTAQAESLDSPGFCYIDPAKVEYAADDVNKTNPMYPAGGEPQNGAKGTNPLVENCPATQRRLLRFVGKDTPAPDTITFVACVGDAAGEDQEIPPSGVPGEEE